MADRAWEDVQKWLRGEVGGDCSTCVVCRLGGQCRDCAAPARKRAAASYPRHAEHQKNVQWLAARGYPRGTWFAARVRIARLPSMSLFPAVIGRFASSTEFTYFCLYCDSDSGGDGVYKKPRRGLAGLRAVATHVLLAHTDLDRDGRVPCPLCNKMYSVEKGMHTHMQSAHAARGDQLEPTVVIDWPDGRASAAPPAPAAPARAVAQPARRRLRPGLSAAEQDQKVFDEVRVDDDAELGAMDGGPEHEDDLADAGHRLEPALQALDDQPEESEEPEEPPIVDMEQGEKEQRDAVLAPAGAPAPDAGARQPKAPSRALDVRDLVLTTPTEDGVSGVLCSSYVSLC